ncbi:basic proline-rich protein-like [Onychomys torridus]|uniref:basic proline-rich protein-like n=1 Tax=Onychomys torridus TaxID=38674 RepID=UPI00167FAA2F|nr:basic proline-rich protein-like [Onychomys torridus]
MAPKATESVNTFLNRLNSCARGGKPVGNAVPIPSPEPCHPDAERKRVLAVSRGRPAATFPPRKVLGPGAGATAGQGKLPRAGRPGRQPPSADPEPRTPAPPRPRAARAPAPGAAGVWDAAAAGAKLARGRAAPARYLPQQPPSLLGPPARPPPSPGKRKRNSARRGLSGPRALSALPQQAGARGLHGATRLWRDRARRASGPSRCRLQGQLHPPPTARAARPAGHAPSPATPLPVDPAPPRRPRPQPSPAGSCSSEAPGPPCVPRPPPLSLLCDT